MYYRSSYITQIDNLAFKGVITVLVGLRRIGKSTILEQYRNHVGREKCLYIPREYAEFDTLQNHTQLYEYIKNNIKDTDYILIDEVQLVSGWEKTINALLAEYGTSKYIIITGSNSDLLSTEISTLLRGRTFEIYVYPFSFVEYCSYL